MALAAEMGCLFARHAPQIVHREELSVGGFQAFEVVPGVAMAMFALHARDQSVQIQLGIDDRVGRMASET